MREVFVVIDCSLSCLDCAGGKIGGLQFTGGRRPVAIDAMVPPRETRGVHPFGSLKSYDGHEHPQFHLAEVLGQTGYFAAGGIGHLLGGNAVGMGVDRFLQRFQLLEGILLPFIRHGGEAQAGDGFFTIDEEDGHLRSKFRAEHAIQCPFLRGECDFFPVGAEGNALFSVGSQEVEAGIGREGFDSPSIFYGDSRSCFFHFLGPGNIVVDIDYADGRPGSHHADGKDGQNPQND